MIKVWALYQQKNWIKWLPYLLTAALIAGSMTTHVKMGWFGFYNAFFGLILLVLGLWVLKTGFDWLLFTLFEKKQLALQLFQFLHENQFPKGEKEITAETFENYLLAVANNEQMPVELRLKAVHLLGVMNAYRKSWLYQEAVQLKLAFEQGYQSFKNQV